MVGKTFDLLGRSVSGERLEGFDDAGMEHPPSFLEQTAIGDFVGEGMLEGLFVVRKEPRFVQEFGSPELRQPAM
jgi:hypothetical protein